MYIFYSIFSMHSNWFLSYLIGFSVSIEFLWGGEKKARANQECKNAGRWLRDNSHSLFAVARGNCTQRWLLEIYCRTKKDVKTPDFLHIIGKKIYQTRYTFGNFSILHYSKLYLPCDYTIMYSLLLNYSIQNSYGKSYKCR